MQIVGIQSYDIAKMLKEKEERENRKEYSKAERHNAFCGIGIFLASVAFATLANFAFNGFKNPFAEFDVPDICIYIICLLLGGLIYMTIKEDVDYKCWISDFTPIYQYAFYTNGKNVLKTDYRYRESFSGVSGFVLQLDLEDINTKEVSKQEIGVFRQITRTDVSDVTFDLEKKVMILPYEQEKF